MKSALGTMVLFIWAQTPVLFLVVVSTLWEWANEETFRTALHASLVRGAYVEAVIVFFLGILFTLSIIGERQRRKKSTSRRWYEWQ